MTLTADRLSAVGAELGEGPCWHRESQHVLWVDILRGEVHACDLDGHDRILQTHDTPVGALALNVDGEALVATPSGLADQTGKIVAPIPVESADLRMNDGKCDPMGRFVGGTMTIGDAREGAGALWSVESSRAPRKLVSGATIPNGLAWSADGSELYWIDTPTGGVDKFEYDLATGELSGRQRQLSIAEEEGAPDGMCIDTAGRLWIALWGGGVVRCYDGAECVEQIEIGTPLVTCPAFVGVDFNQLVITTASIDFDVAPAGAGDLYLIELDATGTEPHRFEVAAS